MAVQSRARLEIASFNAFYDWDNPFQKSLLRGYDERSVLREHRRVLVGDIAGKRRPLHFISHENVQGLPASRHKMTLRLRRLERRVLFWKNVWSSFVSLLRVR